MKKTFIFDRDNLRQVFDSWRARELLHMYYKNVTQLYTALIEQKSAGAEYVLGAPGVGKTTFAMQKLGARSVTTKQDITDLLAMKFDDMVFVTCEVDEKIAKNAKRITLLHTSEHRLKQHRQERDKEIELGVSQTAFGRNPETTAQAMTNDDITISILKTDYEAKSRIVCYRSNDPTNFDAKEYIDISHVSDKRKYQESGIVLGGGKWAPVHKVHVEYQLEQVLTLAREKGLPAVLVVGQKSGDTYDFGLTQKERKKLIELVLKGDYTCLFSTPKFLRTKNRQICKIIPEKSRAVLGKERLPEGFTQGSYQDLVQNYPEFMNDDKKNASVAASAGYNFVNIGTISMDGVDEKVSATFVRKCLIEGDLDAARPYLSPEIFKVLTTPQNLQAIRRRYALVQQRGETLEEAKQHIIQKYRSTDPVKGTPLQTKTGKVVPLTRKLAEKYETQEDKAKVFNQVQKAEKIHKQMKSTIQKQYRAKIYSDKNKLKIS